MSRQIQSRLESPGHAIAALMIACPCSRTYSSHLLECCIAQEASRQGIAQLSMKLLWACGAGARAQLTSERTATTSGGVNMETGVNITEIPSQWNMSHPDPGSGPLAPLNATVSGELTNGCTAHPFCETGMIPDKWYLNLFA